MFSFEGTAPNGQSVKLLYTIQFENINIISTHITSPSWYEVDVTKCFLNLLRGKYGNFSIDVFQCGGYQFCYHNKSNHIIKQLHDR